MPLAGDDVAFPDESIAPPDRVSWVCRESEAEDDGAFKMPVALVHRRPWRSDDDATSAVYGAFGRLIRFANCRYAPGTPARNCLNHA